LLKEVLVFIVEKFDALDDVSMSEFNNFESERSRKLLQKLILVFN